MGLGLGLVRAAVAILVGAVALAAASGASADRLASKNERRAIAKVVEMPAKCTKARISTATKRPKWAAAWWRPGPKKCEPYGRDGAAVLKRKRGKWRFVTAGSDFDCPRLYRQVPRRVARDLELPCH